MHFDNFGKNHSESDFDAFDEVEFDDEHTADRVETGALEQWLHQNHELWQLGLHLATVARQYRQEYQHVPFNEAGWFSPN